VTAQPGLSLTRQVLRGRPDRSEQIPGPRRSRQQRSTWSDHVTDEQYAAAPPIDD
jgi:hypothetical protein